MGVLDKYQLALGSRQLQRGRPSFGGSYKVAGFRKPRRSKRIAPRSPLRQPGKLHPFLTWLRNSSVPHRISWQLRSHGLQRNRRHLDHRKYQVNPPFSCTQ